jgi:predicted nucleic acid-binding Zn ribbon protein
MPFYVYQNPNTGEVIEVMQSMKEKHEYTDSEGVKWNRVFLNPNASIDTKIDPFRS